MFGTDFERRRRRCWLDALIAAAGLLAAGWTATTTQKTPRGCQAMTTSTARFGADVGFVRPW